MADTPNKNLPDEIVIDGQTWKLMEPGLYMRNHIGEVTASDGTVFNVSGSLNGLSVYLETPYEHPNREGVLPKQIVGKAMYMLSAGATIQALALAIMECPDAEG